MANNIITSIYINGETQKKVERLVKFLRQRDNDTSNTSKLFRRLVEQEYKAVFK
jgi:hypothetical protein